MEQQKSTKKYRIRSINLTSAISMSLVLFLIGLISLMAFLTKDMAKSVKENVNLSVVLDDNIGKQYEHRIEKYLKASPYVSSIEYVSKEDALAEHVKTMGDNPEEFLGYNPLSASLEVKLSESYANNDSVQIIEKKLKNFDHIKQVVWQKDVVGAINDNVRKINLVLLGLAVILFVVSVLLINNTIRLSLYSNRFYINTMKLVGATHWFIRRPYIVSGMLSGLVASFISFVFLGVTILFVQNEFDLSSLIINPFAIISVSFIVILCGITLTAISSFFAVSRYLRMNSNDMYMA
jgi:cell division transport system permease protein